MSRPPTAEGKVEGTDYLGRFFNFFLEIGGAHFFLYM